MVGDKDPITPPVFAGEIAELIDPEIVQMAVFDDCGHGVFGDVAEAAFPVLREFIGARSFLNG